ncbi:hypothetical protein MFM001_08520 [Mycobacterium sp. MFM001]|nr:hypothetical protein MFM001_08520 [Mycobacterium sp. MFM001]
MHEQGLGAAINTLPVSGVVAAIPTTYAGDRLLTSVRAADGDGHVEAGRTGRRDRRRVADQSGRHDNGALARRYM